MSTRNTTPSLAAAIARGGLAALLLSAVPATAQTSVSIPGLQPGNQIFGYGDASQRCLARNSAGAIGWFALFSPPNPVTFTQLLSPFTASSVDNIIWERGILPNEAFFVQNVTTFGFPVLYRSLVAPGGALQIIAPSTNPSLRWSVEAVAAGNSRFFLRETSGNSSVNVFTCTTTSPAVAVNPVAPFALRPLDLSPSGSSLAYASLASGPSYREQVTILGPLQPSSPIVTNLLMPVGVEIHDLHWIDDRFLVARQTPQGSPASGKLVRIDRLNPVNPVEDLSFGAPAQPVTSLSISGDRQWLSFIVQQIVLGTPERSVALMRADDGLTTEPGGSFTVLNPLQLWNHLMPPLVQQSSNPLNPNVLYAAVPPGSTSSFFVDNMVRESTVTGRKVGTSNIGVTVDTHHEVGDVIWLCGVATGRVGGLPGGSLLDATTVLTSPVLLSPTLQNNVSQSFTLPVGGTPFVGPIFLQSAFLDGAGNVRIGRVAELPIF